MFFSSIININSQSNHYKKGENMVRYNLSTFPFSVRRVTETFLYFCTVVFLRSGCFFSKTKHRYKILIINLIQRKI